jgi:membrane protein YdbS with pleckstrin-like domain
MYCHNCGNELGSEVLYCPSCGAQQLDAPEGESARGALVVIKPFFTPLNIFVSVIPLQLFFTLWGAVVFGIAGFFAIQYLELDVNPWTVALVLGCLFFVFTPVIAMYVLIQRYARTEYRFFADRLDYREGFYSTEEKSIGYEHIIEVSLVRGFWKRLFNLGTIVLSTATTGDTLGPSRSGIRIPDVQAPQENYRTIRRIIGSCRSSLRMSV